MKSHIPKESHTQKLRYKLQREYIAKARKIKKITNSPSLIGKHSETAERIKYIDRRTSEKIKLLIKNNHNDNKK